MKRHAKMASLPPSADDLLYRQTEDRRGEVYATMQCTNHATGHVTRIVIRHSVGGRTDQFDITVNGKRQGKPVGLVEIMKRWRQSLANGMAAAARKEAQA